MSAIGIFADGEEAINAVGKMLGHANEAKTAVKETEAAKGIIGVKGEAGKALGSAKEKGSDALAKAGKGKSLFSNTKQQLLKHKTGLLIGGGALGAAAILSGGGSGSAIKSVDDALGKAGIPNATDLAASGKPLGAGGAGGVGASGELEIDTEVLSQFAIELRQAADHLHSAPAAMQQVIAQLVERCSTDGAGTKTQDGKPSPASAELVKALEALEHQYEQVVAGVINQLTHDAAAIDKICQRHDDSEHESKRKFDNIDASTLA